MKTRTIAAISAVAVVAVWGLIGCSNFSADEGSATNLASVTSNSIDLNGKVAMRVMNPDGSVAYTDANPNSSLVLKAGDHYNLVLAVSGMPAGTTYELQSTQTDVVSGAKASIPIVAGNNDLSVPTQGDYSWKLVATPPGLPPSNRSYQAQVTCVNPMFTANSLNASQISVSMAGPNLYNLSAAGVVAGANGTAPYTCAYDPTGVGIVDTTFHDCATTVNNFYSNYVGVRKVGLLVKDACNTTVSVTAPLNLDSTEPSMPGNVFISGVLSGATGSVQNDPRVDGVHYLAQNSGGHNIVIPQYGSGNFVIQSWLNYGLPSSVTFGMRIQLQGITDTLNVATGTGTVDASKASIVAVSYLTDRAGDQSPAVGLQSTSCTLSDQGAKVLFVSGVPCTVGQTGDTNHATVEVWGHYTCTLANASGNVSITGNFDGYTDIADSCSGGGGGGGGIVPIGL